jgi:hypothetical protein
VGRQRQCRARSEEEKATDDSQRIGASARLTARGWEGGLQRRARCRAATVPTRRCHTCGRVLATPHGYLAPGG